MLIVGMIRKAADISKYITHPCTLGTNALEAGL